MSRRRIGGGGTERKKKSSVNPRLEDKSSFSSINQPKEMYFE